MFSFCPIGIPQFSPEVFWGIPEEKKRNSCGLYLHEGIIKMEFHSHSDLIPFNTPGIPKVEQKITESELFFCPIIFPRIKKVHSATDKPLIALRQYLTGLLPSLTAL